MVIVPHRNLRETFILLSLQAAGEQRRIGLSNQNVSVWGIPHWLVN